LKGILPANSIVRFSDHVPEKGEDLFRAARKQGLEGIMGKDGASPYLPGVRSGAWLKIKTSLRQEAVIAGFTEPRGSRKKFGALVLGVYSGKDLIYIGHTGTGFDQKSIAEMYAQLKPLITKNSPFKTAPKTNMPVTWVEPKLVGEIKFSEWTEGGNMRQPVFLGLRTDKAAREVVKEEPEDAGAAIKEEEEVSREPRRRGNSRQESAATDSGLKLSHLDKIYWPEEGYTKGDLIDYYRTVSKTILPHLLDRPESMNRHPNGIKWENFFQKNIQGEVPPFVKTVKIRSESEERTINWLICENQETLLYMANLGCIELNPWNARYQNPDRPDYLVIDLDPDDSNTFDDVIKTALLTKKILDKAGAASYIKTSGKSGLHIAVPLRAKYTQEAARQFGEIIANLVHAAFPEKTSVIRDPKKRKGRIYVDFLQNRIGQTIAAPYSVRPWPGATVSAPLKWSEVKKGLLPSKFTIKTMPARIKKMGDLWCPITGKGADLEAALRKLSGGKQK
jgi:bifunctional non-homologous end joining protein LigD